ncbi:MAG: hypothetical protein E3J72_06415 [Planctomycetota bacterium]|nr:MAG: hypothetical protein E3J72_06415 [Planctomycetota bacterium]
MAKAKDIIPTIAIIAVFMFVCMCIFFSARKRAAEDPNAGTAAQKDSGSSEGGRRTYGPGPGAPSSSRSTVPGKGATDPPKTGADASGKIRTLAKARPARKITEIPFFTSKLKTTDSGQNTRQSHPGRKRKVVKFREGDNLPRGTISGTITDSSGNPIAGALVGLFHTNLRGKPRGESRSDANGSYTIGPYRTGRYALHVSSENYAPLTEPVEITTSDVKKDIVLAGGVVLRGVVQTSDNAAVEVEVTAERPGWQRKVSIKAGESYKLQNVPEGDVIITAESPSYVRTGTRIAVHGDEGEITVQTLLLAPGAYIYGKVIDENTGNGVSEASILVPRPDFTPPKPTFQGGAFCTVADQDGNFLLDGVPAGKALLLLSVAPGYVAEIIPVQALTVGEKRQINITLSRAQVIRGRVETWDGIPIENALVTMYAESGNITRSVPGQTDASGEFSFSVPQGMTVTETKFSLLARAYGFAPSIVRIEQGKEKEPVVISLGPGCGLEGTVLGPGGSPVELASIRALPKNMDSKDALRLEVKTSSGREGKYELTALGKGAWSVVFTYGTSAPKILDITFKEAGEKKEIDIVLEPGWRFEGTVTEADGKPLPGVNAFLKCENNCIEPQRTTSDSNGKFSFSGLGDYDYSLILSRTGFESITGEKILQASPSAVFVLKRK